MNRKHFSILNNLLMLLKGRCALINTASPLTSALATRIPSGATHLLFSPQLRKQTPSESYAETAQPALPTDSQLSLLFHWKRADRSPDALSTFLGTQQVSAVKAAVKLMGKKVLISREANEPDSATPAYRGH